MQDKGRIFPFEENGNRNSDFEIREYKSCIRAVYSKHKFERQKYKKDFYPVFGTKSIYIFAPSIRWL
jgi:hypothetical protein